MVLQHMVVSGLSKPAVLSGWLRCSTVAANLGPFLFARFFSSQIDSKSIVNLKQKKDSPKVVHTFDIEDIDKKAIYCRCWRSSKFPYCDGAHAKHNKETGDNVGPLIIKRREA